MLGLLYILYIMVYKCIYWLQVLVNDHGQRQLFSIKPALKTAYSSMPDWWGRLQAQVSYMQVSNLVFYAQSSSTVVSGQVHLYIYICRKTVASKTSCPTWVNFWVKMGAKTTSAKMSKGLPRYSHKTGRDFTECINGGFLSFLVHKIMQTNMTSNLGRLHLV